MTNKYVLFDVGAHWGEDSLQKTKDNLNIETYAFEPSSYVADQLRILSSDFSNRYHVYQEAVSDYDGRANFNVMNFYGVSSLYDLVDNINEVWPTDTWYYTCGKYPGLPTFDLNKKEDVDVTRLDTWFQKNNVQIDKIDYFHCDTQGSDIKVLQGMGDYIELIREGVVECSSDESSKLYKFGTTKEEMLLFLNSKGFKISNIALNDMYNREVNIFFYR
jgi:FkbM family methyltransferase